MVKSIQRTYVRGLLTCVKWRSAPNYKKYSLFMRGIKIESPMKFISELDKTNLSVGHFYQTAKFI